jgi:hypothetical protein
MVTPFRDIGPVPWERPSMTSDTILLRQAHPKFMGGDMPTSQVFFPFPKDDGKLSVYDGDQVNAKQSYNHYTQVMGNESHSVWAITKSEADAEGVPARPDPLPDSPAHAIVDFDAKSEKGCRRIAKQLKKLAIARGCQYRPA